MPPLDYLYRLLEILGLVAGGVLFFIRISTRMSTSELKFKMEIQALKDRITSLEKEHEKDNDRIMDKLEEMGKDINSIQLDLMGKQNRP